MKVFKTKNVFKTKWLKKINLTCIKKMKCKVMKATYSLFKLAGKKATKTVGTFPQFRETALRASD